MYFRASLFALSLLAGSRVLAMGDAAKLVISDMSPQTNNSGNDNNLGGPANRIDGGNGKVALKSPPESARSNDAGTDELMQSAVKSGEIYKNCNDPKSFALTFDDGPYKFGADIADYLEKQDVRATFFVNGYNYGCIYDYADELIARHKARHVIASHTWNHADLTKLTAKQIHQEIDLVEEALWKILGIKPALFRAPYGNLNALATQIITSRGYTIVDWSFDSGDSMGTAPPKSIQEYKTLSPSKDHGPIALNHETHEGTSKKVIPTVVPMLLKKGYKLVTVDECLGVEPYQRIEGKGTRKPGEDEDWKVPAHHKAHPYHHEQHGKKASEKNRKKKLHKSRKGYDGDRRYKGEGHHKEHPHHSYRKEHKGHRESHHQANPIRNGDRPGHSKTPKPSTAFQGTPGKRDASWTCAGTPAPGAN